MKFLRSMILASCLMFGGAIVAQQKEPVPVAKQYDAGVCGAQDFMAVHIVISADKLIVNQIAVGPNTVHETPDDVWKLEKTDKDGLHFGEDDKGSHFELVLKQDKKNIDGLMYVDGKKIAKFYGFEQDGKTLKESGVMLYQMCLQMWESPSGPVSTSSLVN